MAEAWQRAGMTVKHDTKQGRLARLAGRGAPGGLQKHVTQTRRMARWWRCHRGVSAVEFALVAPILAFLLLAGVDMGRAISERMAMDHALRAGAQESMRDPGASRVLEVMRGTAETNFTLADGTLESDAASLNLSAIRLFACPEDLGFAVTSSTICAGSKPPFIYYRMTGAKTYTGWIMPAFGFDRSVQVQIR